jgi:hypothetical protein
MTKYRARFKAVQLLRRHHGWSDRRIAREVGVAPSTVGRWRYAEGLGTYSKRVAVKGREELGERGAAMPRLRHDKPASDPLTALGLARRKTTS